jgi:hypothetical protein
MHNHATGEQRIRRDGYPIIVTEACTTTPQASNLNAAATTQVIQSNATTTPHVSAPSPHCHSLLNNTELFVMASLGPGSRTREGGGGGRGREWERRIEREEVLNHES